MTTADEVAVGRIAGAFGVRGELKCDPTSAGRILFSPGSELRCVHDRASSIVQLTHVRPHGGRLLIRLAGVDTVEAAASYSGAVFYAARSRVVLDEGEYLDSDLVGCEVHGLEGAVYGTVERVEHYPASDMLVVGGRMVPMVRAIVIDIDMPSRRILVDPPAGLFD